MICGSRLSGWDLVSETETPPRRLVLENLFATSDRADPVARCGFGCETRGVAATRLPATRRYCLRDTASLSKAHAGAKKKARFPCRAQTARHRALTSCAPPPTTSLSSVIAGCGHPGRFERLYISTVLSSRPERWGRVLVVDGALAWYWPRAAAARRMYPHTHSHPRSHSYSHELRGYWLLLQLCR